MKKIIAIVLVLVMCVALVSCGGKSQEPAPASDAAPAANRTAAVKDLSVDKIKIAYIPISTAGVTNKMVEMAFNDVLSTYKDNVTLDFFDPGYDPQTEITMLNDCVSQGYDLIFIECADPISFMTPITEAEKAGIPVITLNIGCDAVHTFHIRGVDYHSGYTACQVLADAFGSDTGKNVVIIDCPAEATSTNKQAAGFEDYMKANTNWTIIDHQYIANFSQEIASTTMRDVLTKHNDIDLVFCMQDDLTMGVLQALEASGRNDGSIQVYGNIGYPSTFTELKNHNPSLYGLNMSDMYTEYTVAMEMGLYFVITGQTAVTMGLDKTPELALPIFPVTPDNVDTMTTLSRYPLLGLV